MFTVSDDVHAVSVPLTQVSAGSAGIDPRWFGRDADIQRILDVARSIAGFDVAWLSRFEQDRQVFTAVSAEPGLGPRAGMSTASDGSYCVRVLDGRLPRVIPDTSAVPVASSLSLTAELDIRAYAGVPIRGADGEVRGMLCVTHRTAVPALRERQVQSLDMLAQVLEALLAEGEPEVEDSTRARVHAVIAGRGRHHVLQPIVDIRTGRATGVEALARFEDEPHRPDLWFAEAQKVGLREPLEIAAARSGLESLADRTGYISVNLSPDTIAAGCLDELLDGVDRSRVVVEITEHAPVEDYAALMAALDVHRPAGLRVAIDDAGAGYASFRHILQLRADLIKIDMSLTRDIHLDAVRQALTASLLTFARTSGATVVAEGVETQQELDCLARLGVTHMQGFLLGRPQRDPSASGYIGAAPHVLLDERYDLAGVLAEAVRHSGELELVARPLLEAVLKLTGLETSYLTVLSGTGDLDHHYIRNAGTIELPDEFSCPWGDSLCSSMSEQQLIWTDQAQRDLANRSAAEHFGLTTFLSVPMTGDDGRTLGTVCAASTEAVYISDATISQITLIARLLAPELPNFGT